MRAAWSHMGHRPQAQPWVSLAAWAAQCLPSPSNMYHMDCPVCPHGVHSPASPPSQCRQPGSLHMVCAAKRCRGCCMCGMLSWERRMGQGHTGLPVLQSCLRHSCRREGAGQPSSPSLPPTYITWAALLPPPSV